MTPCFWKPNRTRFGPYPGSGVRASSWPEKITEPRLRGNSSVDDRVFAHLYLFQKVILDPRAYIFPVCCRAPTWTLVYKAHTGGAAYRSGESS